VSGIDLILTIQTHYRKPAACCVFTSSLTHVPIDEVLIQQHKLYSLPRPTHGEVRGLREFICDSDIHGHNSEQEWLHHPENTIWSLSVDEKAKYDTDQQRARAHERAKATQTDLVSLSGHVAPDSFTNLLRSKVVQRFHVLFGHRLLQEDAEFGGHMYSIPYHHLFP
jgi:hypothetical protein